MLSTSCATKGNGLSALPPEAFQCKAEPQPPVWPYTEKDVALFCTALDNAYKDCSGKLEVLKDIK